MPSANQTNEESQIAREAEEEGRMSQLDAAAAASAQILNNRNSISIPLPYIPPLPGPRYLLTTPQVAESPNYSQIVHTPSRPAPQFSVSPHVQVSPQVNNPQQIQRSFGGRTRGSVNIQSNSRGLGLLPNSILSPNLYYALENEKERQNHLYLLVFEIYKSINTSVTENIT